MEPPLRNLAVFSLRPSFCSDDTLSGLHGPEQSCPAAPEHGSVQDAVQPRDAARNTLTTKPWMEVPGTLRLTVEHRKQNCGPITAAETLAGPGGSQRAASSLCLSSPGPQPPRAHHLYC